jgi:LPS export ABC transporter protein LptC
LLSLKEAWNTGPAQSSALLQMGTPRLYTYTMKNFLCLCMFFLIFQCSREQKFACGTTSRADSVLQEFTGPTTLIMSDSGKTAWTMNTTHMIKRRGSNTIVADPVVFCYFGGETKPVTNLTAKYGETSGEDFESFTVRDSVRAKSEKGYYLRTEKLQWNKKSNKITSNSRVHFRTNKGDRLTGIGFESDPDLENWKILKDVQGEFQEFEKRMDKEQL